MFLDREALLKEDDLERETVELGEDKLVLRELSAGEYLDAMERVGEVGEGDTSANIRASLGMVVTMLCEEDGSSMFPDAAEHEEVVASLLANTKTSRITLLIGHAMGMLGVEKDQVAEDVGKSDEIPSDSSSSDSPRISDSQRSAA